MKGDTVTRSAVEPFYSPDYDAVYIKTDEVPDRAEAEVEALEAAESWHGDGEVTVTFAGKDSGVPIHRCDDWQDKSEELDNLDECGPACGFFTVWCFDVAHKP